MLIGIPNILSPQLLKVLMEMGHGDDIVIADGNFPHAAMAQRLVRADGHDAPSILEAVLQLFPLDTFVPKPVGVMKVVEGHGIKPKRFDNFKSIVAAVDANFTDFEYIERFEFYERAKNAYAIVATGDQALYANILLKKGVLSEN